MIRQESSAGKGDAAIRMPDVLSAEMLEAFVASDECEAPRASGGATLKATGAPDVEARARAYLASIPGGVQGQRGSNPTLWAARVLAYGFDLGAERAYELLAAEYNRRCVPPWPEDQLRRKCEEGNKDGFLKPRGWLRDTWHVGMAVEQGGGEAARIARRDAAGGGQKPRIEISLDEEDVNDQAVAALAPDPGIYQRGGQLVRVARDSRPERGIERPVAPRIESLPVPTLRERLASRAEWVQVGRDRDGNRTEKRSRPPQWCINGVAARGGWDGIRHLEAVVEYPVLRPDGTVLCTPGYDPETCLLLAPQGPLPTIPDRPTRADAEAARKIIDEVIADFPFKTPAHKAAWYSGLLTPLARYAYDGPTPLHLVDANVRGAGKGLSLQVISYIVTGNAFTVATYSHEDEELRKRITSLVLEGDRMVLFDNLEGKFGSPALDAALTSTRWKDRVLCVNRTASAPIYCSWYATGNNVSVGADTARRICHIRLDSPHANPEERSDLRHPDLLGYVRTNRLKLLAAALVILRAYFVAGKPDMGLKPWGSYEAWSGVVRNAVKWAGMADPGDTRQELRETADVAANDMETLLKALRELIQSKSGMTSSEIVQRVGGAPQMNEPACYATIRHVVETHGGKFNSRALGTLCRTYRRRVLDGLFLDVADVEHNANSWCVRAASEFNAASQGGGS